MKLNPAVLFDGIRKEFGRLDQTQVDSVNGIVAEFEKRGDGDPRKLAYILATAWHEARLRPIEEIGKGRGKPYGQKVAATGFAYYGRGFVQLTWYDNYATMGNLLGVNLVAEPELAMRPDLSAAIIVEGMLKAVSIKGDFTGKSLEDYFNDRVDDPVGMAGDPIRERHHLHRRSLPAEALRRELTSTQKHRRYDNTLRSAS